MRGRLGLAATRRFLRKAAEPQSQGRQEKQLPSFLLSYSSLAWQG